LAGRSWKARPAQAGGRGLAALQKGNVRGWLDRRGDPSVAGLVGASAITGGWPAGILELLGAEESCSLALAGY